MATKATAIVNIQIERRQIPSKLIVDFYRPQTNLREWQGGSYWNAILEYMRDLRFDQKSVQSIPPPRNENCQGARMQRLISVSSMDTICSTLALNKISVSEKSKCFAFKLA